MAPLRRAWGILAHGETSPDRARMIVASGPGALSSTNRKELAARGSPKGAQHDCSSSADHPGRRARRGAPSRARQGDDRISRGRHRRRRGRSADEERGGGGWQLHRRALAPDACEGCVMSDAHWLNATEIAAAYTARKLSPVELV